MYLVIVKVKASNGKVRVVLKLKDVLGILQDWDTATQNCSHQTPASVQIAQAPPPDPAHLACVHQSLLAQTIQQFGKVGSVAGQCVVIVEPVGVYVLEGHLVIGKHSLTVDRQMTILLCKEYTGM